ncbi:MAG: DUF3810 domain-containing protein [Winogradskyella sp.]|nr:DUF3810 domain-containing protein [Winogradskyella sp.]
MHLNKKLGLTLFLLVQVLLVLLIKNFPQFIESYYSNGFYLVSSRLMRYAFGWLPFSIGDLFYTLAGLYALRWLYITCSNWIKKPLTQLLNIGATLSIIYLAFHLLWGLNYYRQPLHESLEIKKDYTTEELVKFTDRLISKSNEVHFKITQNDSEKVVLPYSKSQILKAVKMGYNQLAKTHAYLDYKPISIKKSIYSLPLTYMGFSGYLNPFTNEAQVDGFIPTYRFPTTASHEVAHQLGYAAENEANFIGAMAAMNHTDIYFNYSGYTFALGHCLNELYRRDSTLYEDLASKINYGIFKNYDEVRQFWMYYQNPLEPVFKSTFDNFLKVNNQKDGMKSYSYVVALLVNYYKDTTL